MSDESEWTTIDGAQERCRVLLDAKNRWMDRAVAAEAVLDAERARADAAEDALLNGPDAAWFARLVKVTARAEKAEADLAAERRARAETQEVLEEIANGMFGQAYETVHGDVIAAVNGPDILDEARRRIAARKGGE